MEKIIRVGTRGSKLALIQTEMVIRQLKQKYPDWSTEIVVIHTRGDKLLDRPLLEFGGKGMFITEFEEALTGGRIDLAVHSAKDIPTELAHGLVIAGTLPRADVRDVLVTRKGERENRVIGTGSLRRQFQMKALYPYMECVSIRGNVPTRLEKVRCREYDGVILAAAGLERLGLLKEPDLEYHYFSLEEMVPAGGQGIIAIEGRMKDEITKLVKGISHKNTMWELETERKVLQLLEAGCHEAIGVFARIEKEEMVVELIREAAGKVYRRKAKAMVEKRLSLAQQLVCSRQRGEN